MSAKTEGVERRMGAWLAALLAWAIPGAGHVYAGRAQRGLIICGVVLTMFVAGLLLGGHLFGLHNVSDVGLLAYVYGFCNFGIGFVYFLCLWANLGVADQAQRATAEYGNIFLMIAGLLNFLAALDAYDIRVGRKP